MDGGPLPPLMFDRFRFDPGRGALLGLDGVEIPLRPKTMAMLRHLLENPGRLIGREELLEAIWPGVYVSDDSITQCVGEIRRALGEAGPRLLKTVPKRGYLFDATVERKPMPEALAQVDPIVEPPIAPPSGQPVAAASRATLPLVVAIGGAAMLVLAMLGGVAWRWATTDASPGQPPSLVLPQRTEAQTESDRLLVEGRTVLRRRVFPDVYLAARGLFRKATEVDPSNGMAFAEIAFTFSNMINGGYSQDPEGDLRAALENADRAVTLAPDRGAAYSARAAAARTAHRFEEALADYRRAVALDPTQILSLANIGLMLVLLGRPEEALEPIRTALARQPDSYAVQNWYAYLGLAELAMGTGDFGAEYFRRSLQRPLPALMSPNARRMHLAAALALHGEVDAARQIAADVRTAQPEMDSAWFRERELSGHPAYQDQRRRFYRGLALAGVP